MNQLSPRSLPLIKKISFVCFSYPLFIYEKLQFIVHYLVALIRYCNYQYKLIPSRIFAACLVVFIPISARFFQWFTCYSIYLWRVTSTISSYGSSITAAIFFFTATASHIIFRIAFLWHSSTRPKSQVLAWTFVSSRRSFGNSTASTRVSEIAAITRRGSDLPGFRFNFWNVNYRKKLKIHQLCLNIGKIGLNWILTLIFIFFYCHQKIF